MHAPCETGSLVEVRGEQWLLTRTVPCGGCSILTLEGRDRTNHHQRLRVIHPFDDARPLRSRSPRKSNRQTALRAALNAVARERSPDALWTAAGASIEVWPYQLEPALAVITGATRVLLADAVGLGKTIQAGLILSELRERGWAQHALIVCPAGLRDGWASELRDRFSIEATILDQPAIADRVAQLPPGVNPWSGHGVAIASIDFIKRPEVMAALAGIPIDLLIADEAHHLAPGTDRGAAVATLAARTPWCILATATPHSGDEAAYAYLTSLGSTGERLTIFRRTRGDVGLRADRRTHVLPITPNSIERELNSTIQGYARALWSEHGADDPWTRLLAVTLARRAASSASAIRRTLERRLEALSPVTPPVHQALLPWDDEEQSDLVEVDAIVSAPGLSDGRAEHALLERSLALVDRCGEGSKLRRIRRMVRRLGEPVIIFTEYRDTLLALMTALYADAQPVAIHGGMNIVERRAAVDAFNGGAARVLVATDAAGEGLNLHHRCRIVIDMELPWNPLKLEQRIGRVDRIGQRRTVHAIRLCHTDSIETRVLDQLRLRGRRADAALNQGLTERDVANSVLADADPVERTPPPSASDAIACASMEAERIASQRRWLSSLPKVEPGVWSSGKSQQLVVLARTTFTSSGLARGDRISAHRVTLRAAPLLHSHWRSALDQVAARIRSANVARPRANGEIVRRIGAIRTRLARDRRRLYQQSLFDGRPDTEAAQRQAAWQTVDTALREALDAACAPVDDDGVRVEIVAAWCEHLT